MENSGRFSEPVKITDEEVEVLPLPGGYESTNRAKISQDGSTVVGNVYTDGEVLELALVRWTEEGVPEILEDWISGDPSYYGWVAFPQQET